MRHCLPPTNQTPLASFSGRDKCLRIGLGRVPRVQDGQVRRASLAERFQVIPFQAVDIALGCSRNHDDGNIGPASQFEESPDDRCILDVAACNHQRAGGRAGGRRHFPIEQRALSSLIDPQYMQSASRTGQ